MLTDNSARNTPSSNIRGLECVQINLHHSQAAAASLGKFMLDTGKNVGLIQEPYLYKNKVSGVLKNYKIFRGANHRKIRTCIIAENNVNMWMLNQFSNEDQVAVQVKVKDSNIVIASTYLPYDSPTHPPTEIMKELIKHCKDNHLEILTGMDANSHHTTWGSTDCNNRGHALLDYIVSADLFILNKGNKATFQNRIRKEVLDLTLCTQGLMDRVVNWKVSDTESFSDHNYICFKICNNFI